MELSNDVKLDFIKFRIILLGGDVKVDFIILELYC